MFAEFAFYVVNSSYGNVLWPRFFIWLSPNTLLKRKTFLKTIVPLFVKSLSSPVTDIVGEKGDNLV